MPIITQADADAQTPVMPPTVAPAPPQTEQSPGALNVAAAALRQGNILSSVSDRYFNGGYAEHAAVPGYDPYAGKGEGIKGYEQYAERFTRAESPAQTQQIKNQIDAENADRRTLGQAGVAGYAASLAAGAVDPITLTSMLIPGAGEAGAATRLARIGSMVATNVAAGEAQSAALAANSETTNYTDGIVPRIGANALLAGVLGHIATRVPRAELDAVTARAGEQVNRPMVSDSTVGAAQVATSTEEIAAGGKFISQTLNRTSPMARALNQPNVEARRLALQLTETPAMLEKNMQGIATPSSIESRVQQWQDTRDYAVKQAVDSQFTDYKKAGGEMKRPEFVEAVTDAMRAGDKHDIPQVEKTAQQLRPFFDADRQALQKLGALPEEFKLLGGESYVPRVYNSRAILQNRTALENALFDHYTRNPKLDADGVPVPREPVEVKDAVYSTLDKILGSVRGSADLSGVKNPSSMKARSLDVPDSVLRPWLSNDIEHIFHGYNRSILPQIEMRRTFGTTDFREISSKVLDEHHIALEGDGWKEGGTGPSDAVKARLTKQHDETMRDLEALHQRVLNQSGGRTDAAHSMVRYARLAMTYNYVRELGGAPLSAIPDIARMIGRYGLANTASKFASFAATSGVRDLMIADARRLGTAMDTALHTRAKSLGELAGEPGGSSAENYASNIANKFTRGTLMAPYDEMLRTVTAALEQDAIHAAVMNKKLSAIQRGKLASVGIGDAELPAIREMWLEHGASEGGLNRACTEKWTDQNAARIVEQAVVRSASRMAFHIGKGDLPLIMSNPLAQMMLQFKSFALTAPGRVLTPLAQGVAHGDLKAMSGVAAGFYLGALAYVVKEVAAGNNKPDLSPERVGAEMLDKSGFLGILPDMAQSLGTPFGMPSLSRFSNRSISESLVGPVAGTADSLAQTVAHIKGHGVSASDVHRIRMLLPFQNVWYARRLIDGIEGKAADALNATGATHQTFVEHVLQDRTEGTPGAPKHAKGGK